VVPLADDITAPVRWTPLSRKHQAETGDGDIKLVLVGVERGGDGTSG